MGPGSPVLPGLAPASPVYHTGDSDPLAPCRLAAVLAVVVAPSGRSATPQRRSAGSHCDNVARLSLLGHRTHPQRTPQARDRGQQSLDPPVSLTPADPPSEPVLVYVPHQSTAADRGGGPLRRAHADLQDPPRFGVKSLRPPLTGPHSSRRTRPLPGSGSRSSRRLPREPSRSIWFGITTARTDRSWPVDSDRS